MKITCEACGSKYTIADDKVQGKRVKVRCKNCKASILVNGGGSGDAEEPEGEALDAPVLDQGADAPKKAPGKKNAWSVNLTDDDSREMTTDELIAGWKDGSVTSDAYVWKDGMGDWKPVLEVPELKAKLLAAKPKTEVGVVTSTKRAPSASAPDDLFGSTDIDVSIGSDMPKGGDFDKKPTGARNESSVLFSLDSLKTPDAPKGGEAKSKTDDLFGGFSGGGLSGGVLGSNTDLLTAPAKDPPPAPVGARPAPVAAAPVEAKKSNTGIIAAAAIVALGALGGGYFAMSGGKGDDAAKIAAEAAAKAEKEAKSAAQEELAKKEAELKLKEEELRKAIAAGQKPPEPAPAPAASSAPPATPAPAPGGTTKPAPGGTTTPAPTPAPAPAAPSGGGQFDAGAAKAALSTAAANTASCAKPGGPTGSGKVEVTFAPSGRVTSANVVSGPFGGTPVGGCIATTFRKAKVPAFSGAPVTVSKSFRIN